MKTTCSLCGETEDTDLINWFRDAEGYWYHKKCKEQFVASFCPPPGYCKDDEHVMDGPPHYENGMGTATCSKCGAWAINVDMFRF